MAADGIIQEGDHVVLDVNGEKLSFVQKLKATGTIRVGKYTVSAAPLVGAPYGSLFEVTADGKNLQRVLLPPDDQITRITETEKDNSTIFDRNTENQKLTHEQIQELKSSGKAGTEIIEALCSNSATFQTKTEFSQDKYKRRKAKKYLTYVTVRRPNARIICEAYYDKCPERVWHLRHDTLAIMLSLANVAAGAKVLVVENCVGVVTAAAVERLGGLGAICALQLDERPAQVDAVRQMNLDPSQRSVLFTAMASSLLNDMAAAAERGALPPAEAAAAGAQPPQPQQQQPEPQQAAAEAKPSPEQQGVQNPAAAEAEAAPVSMDVDAAPEAGAAEAAATSGQRQGAAGEQQAGQPQADVTGTEAEAGAAGAEAGTAGTVAGAAVGAGADAREEGGADGGQAGPGPSSSRERGEQQGGRQRRGGTGGGYGSFLPRPEQLRSIVATGFDSCLLASPKCHPTALLAAVWPLLAPSAVFAVFSPWAQPLAEALSHLQASRNGVLLQLQESWLRPYQVLPARTHPHMMCSGTGGFILSGIKVVPPDATPLADQLLPQAQQPQAQPGGGQRAAGEAAGAGSGGGDAAPAAEGGERHQEEGKAGGEGAGEERSEGGNGGRRGRGRGRDGGRGRGRGGRDSWRDDNGGGRGRGGRGEGGRGKRKAEDGAAGSGDTPAPKRQAQE